VQTTSLTKGERRSRKKARKVFKKERLNSERNKQMMR
jgi:hypothetical protein